MKDFPLPPHECAHELAIHFVGKIENIRRELIQLKGNIPSSGDEVKICTTEMKHRARFFNKGE